MSEEAEFQRLQRAFTAWLRDPSGPPPAGVPDERMRVYHGLVHGTVASLVHNAFPVLRRIVGDAGWAEAVARFTARHVSSTPLFNEVAGEFVAFLEADATLPLPPFAAELAHYEYVELALSIDPAEADPRHADPNGNLMHGVPVLSPLAWPLAYRWPVHRLSVGYQPEHPPAAPTWLLAHRDRGDRVRFTELNAVAARLLALIDGEPAAGRALLLRIATELGRGAEPQPVVDEGAVLLQRWRAEDVVLGTRRDAGAEGRAILDAAS